MSLSIGFAGKTAMPPIVLEARWSPVQQRWMIIRRCVWVGILAALFILLILAKALHGAALRPNDLEVVGTAILVLVAGGAFAVRGAAVSEAARVGQALTFDGSAVVWKGGSGSPRRLALSPEVQIAAFPQGEFELDAWMAQIGQAIFTRVLGEAAPGEHAGSEVCLWDSSDNELACPGDIPGGRELLAGVRSTLYDLWHSSGGPPPRHETPPSFARRRKRTLGIAAVLLLLALALAGLLLWMWATPGLIHPYWWVLASGGTVVSLAAFAVLIHEIQVPTRVELSPTGLRVDHPGRARSVEWHDLAAVQYTDRSITLRLRSTAEPIVMPSAIGNREFLRAVLESVIRAAESAQSGEAAPPRRAMMRLRLAHPWSKRLGQLFWVCLALTFGGAVAGTCLLWGIEFWARGALSDIQLSALSFGPPTLFWLFGMARVTRTQFHTVHWDGRQLDSRGPFRSRIVLEREAVASVRHDGQGLWIERREGEALRISCDLLDFSFLVEALRQTLPPEKWLSGDRAGGAQNGRLND